MKKSTLFTTIAFAFVLLLTTTVNAQKFSKLDKSPMDAASFPTSYKESDKLIKVVYSRPQLNGRALNTLAKHGEVWRTGANEAANITLYKDMKIGGKPISAGDYSLFTIPGEKEWTIILSKDVNVWGAYSYNEANDIVRVKAPVTSGDSLEAFSIAFEEAEGGAIMHLGWDTTRVAVPFTK